MAAIQFTEATKAYPRTIAPAGKYPIVGDRIYRTLQDAQDYVDGKSSSKSAIPGIYLSVIADGTNNGAYWVEQAAGYDGATVGVLRKMGAGGGGGGDISLAWDDITGKPTFAAVATSGSYNDLTDKPTIPDLSVLGALAYKDSLSWSEMVGRPTKLSDFTNDAGFITSAALVGYLKEEDAETIYITEEEAENRYVKRGGDSIDGDISFGGSIKIGGATLSWDEASHALKVDTPFYSEKQIASGGIGDASGSGLGLILNEWPTDSEDYSKYALGGNLGIELNTRLTAVEGKATNVTVSPTLSQGKPMGTIMVDGVSQTMYAPSRLSQMDADFVDKSLLPYDDGACSLGSASRQWTMVFAEDFEASNSVTAPLGEFGNLGAHTAVFSDLLPSSNNPGDIGGNSRWWSNVYATTINSQRISAESIDAASDDLTLGVTYHCEICFYDNYEGETFARFGYTGSHIYTALAVDGALSVNGASVATQTWADGRYVKRGGDSIDGDISFGGSIKIGGATLSWDEASHALKVDTPFYSEKQIASGGIGDASGSGLGLILNEWPTDSEDYSKYALGGNLGIELNTRLTAVEGKATNVTVSPTLSQGKPMGTIMVDGVSQTMYAPSRLSQMDADFVDKSLLPYDDGACSLGSASRQWTMVFAEDFEASNSVTAPLGEFGNLGAHTAVFSDLLPSSNNPGDIGGNSRWWSNVYATTINSQRISAESIDAASDDLTLGVTYHCEICFYDNYEGETFARFGYTGSHIYTALAVDGALSVNGASVAGQLLFGTNSDTGGYFASGSDGTYWGAYTHSKTAYKASNVYFYPNGEVRIPTLLSVGVDYAGNLNSGKLKIGNAILSWDSTNNALKIEGNVYATGQMASGRIGTAVATIASDHEDRIAQLEAKVESLMS